MSLYETIVNKIQVANAQRLVVVIDAQYLLYKQKMVYVELGKDMSLDFYVVTYSDESVRKVKMPVHNMLSVITGKMGERGLFGVSVAGTPDVGTCSVTVSNELGMLIFESAVYKVVRTLAEQEALSGTLDYSSVILRFSSGDSPESTDTIVRLLQAFKQTSLQLYGSLVYAGGNNRFVNRLQKSYKFYTIQKSFIPVFMDCSLFYNPLNDSLVKRTLLYSRAVEKNRIGSVTGENIQLSGYFMTHEEICRALQMRHFMRFTPNFWYQFFAGLLFPNAGSCFPNMNEKRLYLDSRLVAGKGLKPVYTFAEMAALAQKYRENAEDERSTEMLALLNMYEEHDTLYKACKDAHTQLTSFGPVSLDRKETSSVQAVYSYLCEASITFVN